MKTEKITKTIEIETEVKLFEKGDIVKLEDKLDGEVYLGLVLEDQAVGSDHVKVRQMSDGHVGNWSTKESIFLSKLKFLNHVENVIARSY